MAFSEKLNFNSMFYQAYLYWRNHTRFTFFFKTNYLKNECGLSGCSQHFLNFKYFTYSKLSSQFLCFQITYEMSLPNLVTLRFSEWGRLFSFQNFVNWEISILDIHFYVSKLLKKWACPIWLLLSIHIFSPKYFKN